MGLLGALKGLGDASASIGQTGVNYAFQQQRDESEDLRQRAIAKYSQQLSDESWAVRNAEQKANEQGIYERNRADTLSDQRAAGESAWAKTQVDEAYKANSAAQEQQNKIELEKIKGAQDRQTEAAKGGPWDLKDGMLWKKGTDEVKRIDQGATVQGPDGKPLSVNQLDLLWRRTFNFPDEQTLQNMEMFGQQKEAEAIRQKMSENPLTEWIYNGYGVDLRPKGSAIQGSNNAETTQAPPGAVEYLKQNPALAPQFKAKYGYLPEGFDGR